MVNAGKSLREGALKELPEHQEHAVDMLGTHCNREQHV